MSKMVGVHVKKDKARSEQMGEERIIDEAPKKEWGK